MTNAAKFSQWIPQHGESWERLEQAALKGEADTRLQPAGQKKPPMKCPQCCPRMSFGPLMLPVQFSYLMATRGGRKGGEGRRRVGIAHPPHHPQPAGISLYTQKLLPILHSYS